MLEYITYQAMTWLKNKKNKDTLLCFGDFVYTSVTVDTVVKSQPIQMRFLDWGDQSE